jgi:hypothetical protein
MSQVTILSTPKEEENEVNAETPPLSFTITDLSAPQQETPGIVYSCCTCCC